MPVATKIGSAVGSVIGQGGLSGGISLGSGTVVSASIAPSVEEAAYSPAAAQPKVTEVLPEQLPSAWGGATTTLEFSLPSTCGKVTDVNLALEFSITDPSGAVLQPSFYWLDQMQLYVGSLEVENLSADALFYGTFLTSSDQTVATIAAACNATTGGKAAAKLAEGVGYRRYVPIWTGATRSQLFVRGFTAPVRYKFRLASSCRADGLTTGVTLTGARLFVTTASLSPQAEAALISQHASPQGVAYRACFQQESYTNVDLLPASRLTSIQLRSITDRNVAALMTYVRPQDTAQTSNLTRTNLEALMVKDADGHEAAPLLPADYLETFLGPSQVFSSAGNRSNHYITPFCLSLSQAIDNAKFTGAKSVTDKWTVHVQPKADASAVKVVTVAYTFGLITCKAGVAEVLRNVVS
jgi:hypothetical protein